MDSCVGKNKDQSSEKKEIVNEEIENNPCQENKKKLSDLKDQIFKKKSHN